MIQEISIKNFGLLSDVVINFDKKLNVLTGETGAGKSLIISALKFAMGNKIDKELIVSENKETVVRIVIDANTDLIKNIVGDFDDDILIIERSIDINGKSRILLNGHTISQSMLKEIACNYVEIYGQFEHQALLNVKTHLQYLDDFIGNKLDSFKFDLQQRLQLKSSIDKKIKTIGGDDVARQRERDILQYQIQEIESANLIIGEDDELMKKHNAFIHLQKINDAVSGSYTLLNENDDSIVSRVCQVKNCLKTITNLDGDIDNACARLESIKIDLVDLCDTLENITNKYEFDEQEINCIEERLELIKNLKRKYGGSIDEILQFYEQSKSRLDEIDNSEELLNDLTIQRGQIMTEINNICEKITDVRKEKSKIFLTKVTDELSDLGMKNVMFEYRFIDIEPNNNGKDFVELYFSANKGQELKQLDKIVSGGELSRIMLAIKIVLNNSNADTTLIFDEIDTGISGEVGQQVAKKLSFLGENNQILVITHLPAIASMADNHLFVSKMVQGDKTISIVKALDENGRLSEIARLSGGLKESKVSLAHAIELRNFGKQCSRI